jgi:fumarate hydratase subunit beta
MTRLEIISPFEENTVKKLKTGDILAISGEIYSARDAAHKRLAASIEQGKPLPFGLAGQTIYYMGPSPAPPGRVIGSCGPTTSTRMDAYTPAMLEAGIRAFIGKGKRSEEIKEALRWYNAVYFVTYGGAGALLARSVLKAEVVAYPELGAEAVMRLEVRAFPAIVAYDIYGGDLFTSEIPKYASL